MKMNMMCGWILMGGIATVCTVALEGILETVHILKLLKLKLGRSELGTLNLLDELLSPFIITRSVM